MKKDLMSEDLHKFVRDKLGKERWITVYSYIKNNDEKIVFYSALIPNEKADEVLRKDEWDLFIGKGLAGYIQYSDGKTKETKYFQFGNDMGIEPLIFLRSFGNKESYLEISQEFRHYHNLYEEIKNKKFIKIDDNGDEEDVIKMNESEIKIKLKFIKEFLSVKKMNLAIYFELDRYSTFTLEDLDIKKLNKVIKGGKYIYDFTVCDWGLSGGKNNKSSSRIMGKKLIKGLKNFDPNSLMDGEEKDYEDFIIGVDEDGNEILYTCDPHKLYDGIRKNPEAPYNLTPVFFKRDVLTKYYSNPQKYSVKDSHLRCKGYWQLIIDNNQDRYVIVYLRDLGRSLSHKEQLYWKSFNVVPDGHISRVMFKRSFLGEITEPEKNDLLFKNKFQSFQKKWFKKFGWYLLKPLVKDDEHFYQSLRIPLTNDQHEFDQQVLALTKILIDSLNEKELKKSITKIPLKPEGITKFEEFLKLNKLTDFIDHISFLRNLQYLRSSGVGHRKGKKYKRISLVFHIGKRNLIDIFDDILKSSILLLNYLEEHFLK